MRIELTHDIIALKIWEQLPEQDKQLRMVKNSLHQRLRDYNRGSGSLLGEKELIAWEELLDLLKLSTEQKEFIHKSKVAVEQKKTDVKANEQRELQLTQQKLAVEKRARKRQIYFSIGLGVLAVVAIGLSIWALNSQKQANKNEEEAKSSAEDLVLLLQNLTEVKEKETFVLIEKAKEEYNFKAILFLAETLKISLDSSENQIRKKVGDKVNIQDLTTIIHELKNKMSIYILTYGAIVKSGKASKYKQLMEGIDKAILKKNYDDALTLNEQVSNLKIDFIKDEIRNKEITIKQQAFDYYFGKALRGFESTGLMVVLSKKFINPFKDIQKAESYLPEGTLASKKLKDDICSHPTFKMNIEHPEILKIKRFCN